MRNDAFERLVDEYLEDGVDPSRSSWVDASKRFFGSPNAPAVLNELKGDWCVVLHGSAARGIDDEVSDLDFWLLVDEASLKQFDAISSRRFVEFDVEGKPGHIHPLLFSEIDDAFSSLSASPSGVKAVHPLLDRMEIDCDPIDYLMRVGKVMK